MWSGKTAVVTGASGGIGAAICRALAADGLRVVGLDVVPGNPHESNSELAGKGTIQSRLCDITKLEEVNAAFQWVEDTFGGTDLLVNCAGRSSMGQITNVGDHQISDEEVASIMNVNIMAMIFCTRRAVASMKKRGFNGHIININSIAGHYIPFTENFNVYASSKYAVTAFTGSLANEFGVFASQIKITSISPGLVRTPLAAQFADPLQPALHPADVAEAVRYVLTTPPHVNITELTIQPIAEKRL